MMSQKGSSALPWRISKAIEPAESAESVKSSESKESKDASAAEDKAEPERNLNKGNDRIRQNLKNHGSWKSKNPWRPGTQRWWLLPREPKPYNRKKSKRNKAKQEHPEPGNPWTGKTKRAKQMKPTIKLHSFIIRPSANDLSAAECLYNPAWFTLPCPWPGWAKHA